MFVCERVAESNAVLVASASSPAAANAANAAVEAIATEDFS